MAHALTTMTVLKSQFILRFFTEFVLYSQVLE